MDDVRNRLSEEAVQKNNDGNFATRDFLREVRNDIEKRGSGLFVIEQLMASGQRSFWNCSADHGCGWHSGQPKQAFSKSQLGREIALMIERGFFCTIIVRELFM